MKIAFVGAGKMAEAMIARLPDKKNISAPMSAANA